MEKQAKNIKKRLKKQEPEKYQDKSYSTSNIQRWGWDEDWHYPLFPVSFVESSRFDNLWFKHVDYQFIAIELILDGAMKYENNETVYTANKGDCFIILPHSNVRIVNAQEDTLRRKIALLLGGSAPFALARLLGFEEDTLLKLTQPEILEHKIRKISEIIKNKCSHDKAAIASYELLLLLAKENRKANDCIPEDMLRVKNYFCDNYATKINITEVASLAGMSPSTLRRKFQHWFGISPLKYLCTMRLEQAITLLHDKRKSIKEIGYLCGFNSALYFTESFKEHWGCSPRQYRYKLDKELL